MGWLTGAVARIRSMVLRRSLDRDSAEEMRFHLDMEIAKNVDAGMPPEEARRQAYVAFGGVEKHRERLREGRQAPFVEDIARDLQFAGRSLRRVPGFAIVAIITVALGVGATTTVFSIANAFLFRPIPAADAQRLYSIQESRVGRTSVGIEGARIPFTRYQSYVEGTSSVFSGLAAVRGITFSMRTDEETLSLDGTLVSGNFFGVLGLMPAAGRFFSEDDSNQVVLGHDLWIDHFSADPDVVGSLVVLDGHSFTVVGVAPAGFHSSAPPDISALWIPIRAAAAGGEGPWEGRWVSMFGRLRRGVSAGHARAVVNTVALTVPPDEPQSTVRGASLDPLAGAIGPNRLAALGFFGMLLLTACMVLLIASANLAGMLLARSVVRQRELAIRLAIGAGRGRIIGQLLTEGLLLFVMGGLGGVALAYWGTTWLAGVPLPVGLELALDFTLDRRVLLFSLAITLTFGLGFSLLPALKSSHSGLLTSLREGGSGSATRQRWRNIFVVGQVAMSVLLLLGATLAARSLQSGLDSDIGFHEEGVLVAAVDLAAHGYDSARGRDFFTQFVDRVKELDGVQEVALAQIILLSGDQFGNDISTPEETPAGVSRSRASHSIVGTNYFRVMGTEIVAGRDFTRADLEGSPPVMVVNQTVADRFWPGQSPIGKRLRRNGTEFEVIGLTRTGKYVFMGERPIAFTFTPWAQSYRSRMSVHVRAPGAEAGVLRGIREVVRALDANVAVESAGPLTETIQFSLFPYRFLSKLIGLFGIVGLLLAAIGLYGVLAFQVSQRMREMGIRRALGAKSVNLVRMVVSQGGVLAAIGCGVGVAGGIALSITLRGFLMGLQPIDPVTFLVVPLGLFVVALLASTVPALRAISVEAIEALRQD